MAGAAGAIASAATGVRSWSYSMTLLSWRWTLGRASSGLLLLLPGPPAKLAAASPMRCLAAWDPLKPRPKPRSSPRLALPEERTNLRHTYENRISQMEGTGSPKGIETAQEYFSSAITRENTTKVDIFRNLGKGKNLGED